MLMCRIFYIGWVILWGKICLVIGNQFGRCSVQMSESETKREREKNISGLVNLIERDWSEDEKRGGG